ncbi:MAG: hypothetical protein M3552_07350 [Planctomycetota bacterium]|nr:hypothetical protein [Planctomycetaceae bacterium]MDQ3330453.1 hypothetical protein [Planctomycetota bacterium]
MRALVRYAFRSLGRRPLTAVLLAVSLGIAFGLPGAVRSVVAAFEEELTARADAAPLVFGAAGSRSDLVLHALFFRSDPPGEIRVADRKEFDSHGLAETVPLCVKATVRGVPVVGTDGGYFKLRRLRLDAGDPISRLGDCVLGARAAERLGLKAGEKAATDPENLFGASGGTPVRLRITGVLAAMGSADDDTAFVSLETAWLIAGLGHGHSGGSKTHAHEDRESTSSGYVEVTDENVEGFHFHGRPERFPLTAVIAIPHSRDDRLLLISRYLRTDEGTAVAESDRVLRDLLSVAVRVRRLFDANAVVTTCAMILLCATVVTLSVRLRWPEVQTMHRLGLSRTRIASLFAIEVLIVGLGAFALGLTIVLASHAAAPVIFKWFVV